LKTGVDATHFSHNFFSKEKRKKESRLLIWKVSKKQVFRIKYYPVYISEFYRKLDEIATTCRLAMTSEGWRFYPKPEGLELAFLNTWNIFLFSFFSFLF
jgi:hypothetical protein